MPTQKYKYRNLLCEITKIVLNLAENSVFISDLITCSEKLIEKMNV